MTVEELDLLAKFGGAENCLDSLAYFIDEKVLFGGGDVIWSSQESFSDDQNIEPFIFAPVPEIGIAISETYDNIYR